MNPTLRRVLIISAFVLIVMGFFYVIYLVFFRPVNLGPTQNANGNVNGLPVAPNGNTNTFVPGGNVNDLPVVNDRPNITGASRIANGGPTQAESVVGAASSGLTVGTASGNVQFYDRESGKFFQLSPDGTSKTLLTDATYPGVEQITWSPNGSQAILEFPDQSKVLYNFTTKKQTTLPKELDDFSFSAQSDRIVSKYLNAQNRDDQWLMVSNPDGSQSFSAEHLGENASRVTSAWSPNNQIIATYQKAVTGDLSEIIFLGAQGENFPSVNIEGRGFTPKWSPDGRRLLYSAYSASTNDNPRLYIMNGSPEGLGTQLLDLGLDTRADKCTFSQTGLSIYCAVPYYLNAGSGPQPELSRGVPDNIYRIDLLTGTSSLIARPVDSDLEQRFSIQDLQLTPQEDALFFRDQITGAIHRIQIK